MVRVRVRIRTPCGAMGVRTAASRLGWLWLGYAAASARRDQKQKVMMNHKISSSFSQFMRRSSTLAAAARDLSKMKWESKAAPESKSESELELELELNKEKTLYLCFSELSRCGNVKYCTDVIRPIKLSDVLSITNAVELREAAYKRSKVLICYSECSRFGSQILLAGGARRPGRNVGGPSIRNRDICWFETQDPNPKFQVSSPRKTKIKSFSTGKREVKLGELDRKLYCIANNPFVVDSLPPLCNPFEVLDPADDAEWRPLEAPPFIREETEHFSAAFVEGSNKILGWEWEQPGVFCFDATRPEKGWIESPSCLGTCLPFLDYHRPFFIHHHDPNVGGFQVMFTYDSENAPEIVTVFLMSQNCDSLQPMNKPLQLPELPYEFQNHDHDLKGTSSTHFEFVHLGGQKVCLVLYKFFYPRTETHAYNYWSNKEEVNYNERNKGSLLLITFEYDIISNTVDSKSSLDIQYRLLGTRRLQYFARQLRKPDPTSTNLAALTGAFLL